MPTEKFELLREQAQELLNDERIDANDKAFKNNLERLLEELSVSQIELELQNEELRSAQWYLTYEKQRFQDLYDNAPVGYFQLDKNGKILDCNTRGAQIFAVSKNLLIDRPMIAFIQKEYTTFFYNHLREIFSQEEDDTEDIELRVKIKPHKGTVRQLKLKSNILKDNQTQEKYCRTIAADITEREESKQRIEGLNIRLENSMIAGNMAWWEMEMPSGKIIFNENKTRMLGYEAENFKHYKDFMDLVHPEDYRHTMDAMVKHMKGEAELYECEYRIRNAGGNYIWFYDVGRLTYANGKTQRYNGIVQNVTSRKFAEQALVESEESLSGLINSVPLGVFIHRPEENGRFTYVNQASADLTGYTQEELRKMTVFDIDADSKMREDAKNIWAKLSKGKHYTLETKHKRKDGSTYLAEVNFTLITYKNKPAVFAVVQDITQRKEYQIALEQLNKTKDKFFNIIAHDLRSPFNALLGFSDLLYKKHKQYDEQKREKIIGSIRTVAKSSYELIENLLTWSRTQTGKIEFSPEDTALKELIFESVYMMKTVAEKKGIKIINNVDCTHKVNADKAMFHSVMRNLISNSVKFTHKNGRITISCEEPENPKYIRINVEDTGIGMSKEQQKSIFRIDKQSSTVGTDKEVGTGLGLPLCKEFVEKHGGEIWVESQKDKGSAFSFTLPKSNNY